MSNKRRTKRAALLYYLQIVDRNSNKFFGRLVNISSEGVMVLTDHPIDLQSVSQLKMLLPAEIFSITELDFDAVCVWCRSDVNPHYFVSGFQMLDITQRDVEAIVNLIVDLGLPV
jgi:hypothetical protein